MSLNNQTHIQHTKSWSTCWAGWGTRHPNIWTMLILSTCKPLPHTFQTPHGSTITGNTFTLAGCSTHFLKLDVCRLLHAANTGLWLLNTVQRKDRLKLENQMPKRVKTNWTARNFNQTRMYYRPLSGNGKAEWRELWVRRGSNVNELNLRIYRKLNSWQVQCLNQRSSSDCIWSGLVELLEWTSQGFWHWSDSDSDIKVFMSCTKCTNYYKVFYVPTTHFYNFCLCLVWLNKVQYLNEQVEL